MLGWFLRSGFHTYILHIYISLSLSPLNVWGSVEINITGPYAGCENIHTKEALNLKPHLPHVPISIGVLGLGAYRDIRPIQLGGFVAMSFRKALSMHCV